MCHFGEEMLEVGFDRTWNSGGEGRLVRGEGNRLKESRGRTAAKIITTVHPGDRTKNLVAVLVKTIAEDRRRGAVARS